MKKILAITCHQVTNPLVHTVNYFSSFPDNVVLIHVDKKSAISDFEQLTKHNVILIDDRVDVQWGGVTQIQATLSLMNIANQYEYDYFFLLSGDDIPIQTNDQFNDFLKSRAGYNFIHYQDERSTYVDPARRVMYKYPSVFFKRVHNPTSKALMALHRILRTRIFRNDKYFANINKMPAMYKGTNWFGLTKNTVMYILAYLKSHDWYLPMFEKSLCADEVFFHTIIKTCESNLLYSDKSLTSNALRYIDWVSGPQYPRILGDTDFDSIKRSKMLLARKIDKDASPDFMMSFITG